MKKLIFMIITLVIILSACSEKENKGFLEKSPSPESDKIAKEVVKDEIIGKSEPTVKNMTDKAYADYSRTIGNTESKEEVKDDEGMVDNKLYEDAKKNINLVSYHDGKNSYYLAIFPSDPLGAEQISYTDEPSTIKNLDDYTVLKFQINDKNKISRMYRWNDEKEIAKHFENKKGLFNVQGNYSKWLGGDS
ncbi:hypothetical protein GZ159_09605 [Staphylococcus aureus]|uniref:hypothetical protein n=1 Tax=Staphylococcus aureus TaxID=1280 RepID=UPI0013A6D49D|nr:hypothetical protein [Staphylococcus aureus]NDQ74026.1 hypothetical protein [Staphylococcus aureus]HDZ8817128.1 hypothetical protein [Staphylococcus aureus]